MPSPSDSPPVPPEPPEEKGGLPFLVVGVGGSAGGLEACVELLQELPAKPGLSLLVVSHLDPGHRSHLPEILGRVSPLTVHEVAEGMRVEVNHVYVIPSGATMALVDGHLTLSPRGPRGISPHMPIDHLFRSLAEIQKNRAVGIVLSGNGSDGPIGLHSIKAVGGITFAQDEATAKHPSMPRSAILDGNVDHVMRPKDMARELVGIARHPNAQQDEPPAAATAPAQGDPLTEIISLLRSRTSVDFTHYKQTTIRRRIMRRMALRNMEDPRQYVNLLKGDAAEIQNLYTDFLIRVTQFSPDALLVTDGHGLILKANQTAVTMFHRPKEFLTGKPLGLFVAEGCRARFYDCLSRLWQGLAGDRFEIQLTSRNSAPRDVAVHVICQEYRGEKRVDTLYRWHIRDNSATKKAEADRLELLRRLATNQEEERRRISRELHDSIGQLLTALSLAVKSARETEGLTPAAAARLVSVQQVVDELGRAAHDLAVRLRPIALDDLGLLAALSQYLREWSSRTGIPIEFEARGLESQRLSAEMETAAFRIVQEALTNVFRHARARRASVAIVLLERQVSVAVEDDGIGFDVDAVGPGRLGLLGMKERAALAEGKIEIESSPGNGTTVIARFPHR